MPHTLHSVNQDEVTVFINSLASLLALGDAQQTISEQGSPMLRHESSRF